MKPSAELYPPAPPNIPADLAKPTSRYRLLTIVVLISLILFVLLYVALVAGAGWLVWWSFTYDMGEGNRGSVLLRLGAIAGSVMLFLFLLKGLFKTRKMDKSQYIRIKKKDHPELFDFVQQLCRDTKAPFPKAIYLTHEVNAAVFYDTSLLSLILPVRKNLLIGLGLVNMVNLNEFKAVLAHEFGHFSQRTMKLGTYVYTANDIITDMVYGRDYWDNALRIWRSIDLRISFPAWGISAVVWVLRKVLAGVFRIINIGNLALTRQMEFNADLVAVGVTGSDALIHALAKLEFANDALMQTIRDLQDASDHKLYSADFFFHQAQAANYLREVRKNPDLGVPPTLPDNPTEQIQVFKEGDSPPPSMWATHPSNFDREQNAKRNYIRSTVDDRSAWALFPDRDPACLSVTKAVYRLMAPAANNIKFLPASKVQEFIDEERAETTYHVQYHGFYDGRGVNPGDVNELIGDSPLDAATLAQRYADLYAGGLEAKMERNRARLADVNQLLNLKFGVLPMTGKQFTFRDQNYRAAELENLLKLVTEELEGDRSWQSALDRSVFCVHFQMARQLDIKADRELLRRYRIQLDIQELSNRLADHRHAVEDVMQYLSTNPEISEGEAQSIIATFREAHQAIADCLDSSARIKLPALRNIEEGQPLDRFLLDDPLAPGLSEKAKSIEGDWINQFLGQYGLVMDRLGRILAKSLGGILALQERIGAEWTRKQQESAGQNPMAEDASVTLNEGVASENQELR